MDKILMKQAEPGDIPALTEIWRVCFGDSDEAVRFIFEKLQNPRDMLVLTVDKTPASMLSTRAFTLTSGQSACAAMYIYGVATHPEYQGRGYGSALLKRADLFCAERGAACSALVPAKESLFRFYQRQGYETAFWRNKVSVASDELRGGEIPVLRSATAGELMRARSEHLGDSALFARWNEEYLSFVIEDSMFCGGGAFSFEYKGILCCAVCHKAGDTLNIKELAAPRAAADALLRALGKKFAANRFVIHLREDVQTSYTNNLLPFGMIKWYDNMMKSVMTRGGGAPAYIAHAMD